MKVHVDQDKCVASGQCVMTAMEVFDQDEDGTAFTLTEVVAPDQVDQVSDAVAMCPAAAISLEE